MTLGPSQVSYPHGFTVFAVFNKGNILFVYLTQEPLKYRVSLYSTFGTSVALLENMESMHIEGSLLSSHSLCQ